MTGPCGHDRMLGDGGIWLPCATPDCKDAYEGGTMVVEVMARDDAHGALRWAKDAPPPVFLKTMYRRKRAGTGWVWEAQ